MPRLISVFDTNVYRQLSDSGLQEIVSLERGRSIVACPSYQVVQELLAHLAMPEDSDFASCHAALSRLGVHCRYYDGQRYMLRFLADALDQVAMSVFKRPLGDRHVPADYAALVGDVVDGVLLANWRMYEPALNEIAATVRDGRASFTTAMRSISSRLAQGLGFPDGDISLLLADKGRRSVLIRALDSDAALDGPAQAVYRQVATSLGVAVGEIPAEPIAAIVKTYPTAMRFFNQVLKKVIVEDWNVEKRNSIGYDVRISFLASGSARVDGVPVCLVSDDRLINCAAVSTGTTAFVMRLEKYRNALRNRGPLPGDQ